MRATLVLLAAIAFAVAPFLSPEFGGFDPDRYPVPQVNPPVQPAGWAFSIWGLIYPALVLHALLGFFRFRTDPHWDAGRIPLFISLVVGAFWLPVALISPIWATVMIWVMLGSAIAAAQGSLDAEPKWIAVWPLALYAGWLTAASFVSIGLLLAGYNFVSEFNAAIIALVMATGFGLFYTARLKLIPYAIALTWGFIGISAANAGENTLLAVCAGAAALLILGFSKGWPVTR